MTTPRRPLTARQAEVFRFIVAFLQENWRTPTLREVSDLCIGSGHPHAAHQHVAALRRKGWIERGRKGCHGLGAIVGCELRIEGVEALLNEMPASAPGYGRMCGGSPRSLCSPAEV